MFGAGRSQEQLSLWSLGKQTLTVDFSDGAVVVEAPDSGRRGSKPSRQTASKTKPVRKTKRRVATAARRRRT